MHLNKISVVGIGQVGSTVAYTLAMRGLSDELALISRNPKSRALGEALDIKHALSFAKRRLKVYSGGVEESANSDVLVLCHSVEMSESFNSRLELGPANVQLWDETVPPMIARSPNAIVVVVSNPVDVLTYHTIQLSGFPPERVLGTGTLIDSARFRMLLSEELGIHPDDLRAYILGEHGSTQFAALSCAEAGGDRIEKTPARQKMFREAVQLGFEVFRAKGYTNFAIAQATATICESIAFDTRRTIPVSVLCQGFLDVTDVCVSLPVVVGRQGVVRYLTPALNVEESQDFLRSARTVRKAIDEAYKLRAKRDEPKVAKESQASTTAKPKATKAKKS